MSDCAGNAECVCPHCVEVRKHERRKIASLIREQGDRFMPTKTNNDKMRKACAFNLAEAVEQDRLVAP